MKFLLQSTKIIILYRWCVVKLGEEIIKPSLLKLMYLNNILALIFFKIINMLASQVFFINSSNFLLMKPLAIVLILKLSNNL